MSLPENLQRRVVAALLTDSSGNYSAAKATPAALEPVVYMVRLWAAQAMEFLDRVVERGAFAQVATGAAAAGGKLAMIALGDKKGALMAARAIVQREHDELIERLDHYNAVISECIATGQSGDPKCTYDQVVNPLVWGWFGLDWKDGGNAIGCSAGEPCVQRLADLSVPVVLVSQAAELAAIDREPFLAAFGHELRQSADDTANVLANAIDESMKTLTKHPAWVWAVGAAIVAGAAGYLYAK